MGVAVNPRAADRLTIVLWKAGGNYLTSAQAGTLAQIIVAAGWGHPDELTDEQVQDLLSVPDAPYWPETVSESFRAALARAFKEET